MLTYSFCVSGISLYWKHIHLELLKQTKIEMTIDFYLLMQIFNAFEANLYAWDFWDFRFIVGLIKLVCKLHATVRFFWTSVSG